MYFIVAILFLQNRIFRFEWWWEVDVSQENSGMLQYCHCKNSSRPSQQIEAAMFLQLAVRLPISCSLNILPASQDPTWHGGKSVFSTLHLKKHFCEKLLKLLSLSVKLQKCDNSEKEQVAAFVVKFSWTVRIYVSTKYSNQC